MRLRRPSWSTSCLCHATRSSSTPPLASTLRDPLVRWVVSGSGAVDRRRHFASVASAVSRSSPLDELPLSSYQRTTPLHTLLSAIQRKDTAATSAAFFAWTDLLASEHHTRADITQLLNLPNPVLSEIIRTFDPINRPDSDVAHGLHISQGDTQFTDLGRLVNEHGVRTHHERVLEGMFTILDICTQKNKPLRPVDFHVFLRCAGAAANYPTTAFLFGNMIQQGMLDKRNTQTWKEFIKARFMTEPTYYQYDRSRVVIEGRDLVTHNDVVDGQKDLIKSLDRIRLSANAFKRQPWNHRADEPEEDIRRLLRRSGEDARRSADEDPELYLPADHRSFYRHFIRQQSHPDDLSEDLLCTSMIGFSRSNDRRAILDYILKGYYDIEVNQEDHTITGGRDLNPSSALYPTERTLFALVESFGAMSEISLAMQLVDFFSRHYSITIPHAVWSNLLNWTYLCASSKLQRMRQLYDDAEHTRINAQDVGHVWRIMTSKPYFIEPSFQDLDVYIRTLIIRHHMDEAVHLIRNSAIPFHETQVSEFQDALLDEVLLKDATLTPENPAHASTISRAEHRRRKAEARMDHTRNRIAMWFDDILRVSSETNTLRDGTFTSETIPNLVRDYPHFFQTGVRYRTPAGTVSITNTREKIYNHNHSSSHSSNSPSSNQNTHTFRQILPTKLSGAVVRPTASDQWGNVRKIVDPQTGEWMENPDFEWWRTNEMRVLEKRRVPFRRMDDLTAPPPFDGRHKKERVNWFKDMEDQLVA